MERTWKTKTAGILTIIGGIVGIVAGALALGITAVAAELTGLFGLGAIGGGFLGLGIVALIGGIMMLKKILLGIRSYRGYLSSVSHHSLRSAGHYICLNGQERICQEVELIRLDIFPIPSPTT